MAFNVRIFGHKGIIQLTERLLKQYSAESVFVLEEPYEFSQILAVPSGGGAVSSAVVALNPDLSTILRVEVPDGSQIRYEINPNGPLASNARIAGNLSPRWSGFENFPWGKGYTISVCDAASWL